MLTEITDVNVGVPFRMRARWSAARRPWLLVVSASSLLAVALGLAAALSARPPWVSMWLIALATFYSGKTLTLLSGGSLPRRGTTLRMGAYLFLWPGMNAKKFCLTAGQAPKRIESLTATANMMAGAALLWIAARFPITAHPVAQGWICMLGLVLLLHFGFFHLLSVGWRTIGVNAAPLMNAPATATSLARFWGGKWNTAFSDLVHVGSKLLVKGLGKSGALLTVFFISGVVHELVITVPAAGGYGLPTLYFVLQGFGVLAERSSTGRRLGLGSGVKGWCFVASVAGLPAFFLFNPIFVYRIILPMLHALGAT